MNANFYRQLAIALSSSVAKAGKLGKLRISQYSVSGDRVSVTVSYPPHRSPSSSPLSTDKLRQLISSSRLPSATLNIESLEQVTSPLKSALLPTVKAHIISLFMSSEDSGNYSIDILLLPPVGVMTLTILIQ